VHATCTFNGTTLSLYVNGAVRSTAVWAGPGAIQGFRHGSNTLFGLGNRATTWANPGMGFVGWMDEMIIWNRALNAGQQRFSHRK
jgi:hypothetical protein